MKLNLLQAIPVPIAHMLDEGEQLRCSGQLREAQARLEGALARAAAHGSVAGLLGARQLLGHLAYDRGNLADAREHHLYVLSECEHLGLLVGVTSSLHNLGLIAAGAGEVPAADQLLLADQARYERLGMVKAAALVPENLARITPHDDRSPTSGADHEQP